MNAEGRHGVDNGVGRAAPAGVLAAADILAVLGEVDDLLTLVVDDTGSVRWASGAADWGLAVEELIGLDVDDVLVPDLPLPMPRRHEGRGAVARTEPAGTGLRLVHRGASTPVEAVPRTLTAAPWEGWRVVHVRWISPARRHDQARLAAALDLLLDFHMTFVPVRARDGTVTGWAVSSVNRAACARIGRSTADLVGAELAEVFPGPSESVVAGWCERVHSSGAPLVLDAAPIFSSILNEERWLDLRAVKVGDEVSITWRDVTERQVAARALAESEERFRNAMAAGPVGICLVDPSGELVQVNQALCRLLGLDEEGLHRARWQDLTQPDDLEVELGLVADVLAGRRDSYRLRKRYVRSDGSVLHGDVSVGCVREADGSVRHFVAQVVDVTAQIEAEHTLAESEARYRTMFNDHEAVMLLIDPESGAVVDANASACRFYGYDRDDICRMSIADINVLPPEEVRRRRLAALARSSNAFVFPHRLADGTVRKVEVHSSPIQYHGGRLLFSVIHDVTQAEEDRAALAASEEQFRRLAESIGDVVVSHDARGRISWISPSVRRSLGVEPESLLGRDLAGLMHPDDAHRPGTHLAADPLGAAEGREYGCRSRYRRADGTYRWMEARTTFAVVPDGRLLGGHSVIRDVHDEVAALEQLRLAHDRLELVLNASRLGTWDWNMQTGETVFNERWAEIVGYTLAELEPVSISTWTGLAHPDDLEESEAAVAAHAAGVTDFYDVRCRMLHRDGHWVWVHDRGRIVARDDEGRPLRMTGTHEDITALQTALIELVRSEERFRTALTSAVAGMATVGLDRRFTQVNPALCRLTGRPSGWLLDHGIADVLHPDDDAVDVALRGRLLAGDLPSTVHDARLLRPDGRVVWVTHALGVIRDDHDEPVAYASQFLDVTETRQARALVEAATEAIAEPFAIWQVSALGPHETTLVRANRAIEFVVPSVRDDLVGRSLADIFAGDSAHIARSLQANLVTALATAAGGAAGHRYNDFRSPPGPAGFRRRVWRPALSALGEGLVAVLLRDVTDEVAVAQRLTRERDEAARAAARDPLTDLGNRRSLMTHLATALSDGTRPDARVGILFCDVDGLKPVNDQLGHAAGDRLLREVARRLRGAVRSHDVVARIGGDEFVVVIADISREQEAVRVAEDLRRRVGEPIVLEDGTPTSVTLSVGVTTATAGDDPASALDRADAALYRAKGSGRDRVVVHRSAGPAVAEGPDPDGAVRT